VPGGIDGLPGDVYDGIHGDAPLARVRKTLAGNLQHDPAIPRFRPAFRRRHGLFL
jgi:hypothetical protein